MSLRIKSISFIISVVIVALGVAVAIPSAAHAAPNCTTTLSPGANLVSAVSSAASGSTICLNNGSYSGGDFGSVAAKTSYVTVQSVNPKGATIGFITIYGNTHFRFQDLNISGADVMACFVHIQFINNAFVTNGMAMRNDYYCSPSTNNDILIDGNTFINLPPATWEGRLSIDNWSNPSGITVSNNIFSGTGSAGCSDGMMLNGTGGVQVGPGNTFSNLTQGSCAAHIDSIQMQGASYTTCRFKSEVQQGSIDGMAE